MYINKGQKLKYEEFNAYTFLKVIISQLNTLITVLSPQICDVQPELMFSEECFSACHPDSLQVIYKRKKMVCFGQ